MDLGRWRVGATLPHFAGRSRGGEFIVLIFLLLIFFFFFFFFFKAPSPDMLAAAHAAPAPPGKGWKFESSKGGFVLATPPSAAAGVGAAVSQPQPGAPAAATGSQPQPLALAAPPAPAPAAPAPAAPGAPAPAAPAGAPASPDASVVDANGTPRSNFPPGPGWTWLEEEQMWTPKFPETAEEAAAAPSQELLSSLGAAASPPGRGWKFDPPTGGFVLMVTTLVLALVSTTHNFYLRVNWPLLWML